MVGGENFLKKNTHNYVPKIMKDLLKLRFLGSFVSRVTNTHRRIVHQLRCKVQIGIVLGDKNFVQEEKMRMREQEKSEKINRIFNDYYSKGDLVEGWGDQNEFLE